jgi:TonB family protein
MKKLVRFLSVAFLTAISVAPVYGQVASQPALKLGVDVLSDTNGTNLDSYMKVLVSDIRKRWVSVVTQMADQPNTKHEETVISLTIAPDGRVLAMRLESSAHDVAVDKAAWSAMSGATYGPSPAGLKDAELKLRVHFAVN